MKRFLLLTIFSIAAGRLSLAGVCSAGPLSSYVALGPAGCTIGGNLLTDFMVLSGITGATAIDPTAVTITPGVTPTIAISTSQSAAASSLLEVIFSYQISGLPYAVVSSELSNSTESPDGGVTGITNICAGGPFLPPDYVSNCMGTSASLLTLDGIQQSDSTAVAANLLTVVNDLTIDGGSAGSASGGRLTNNFSATVAIPEPGSFCLTLGAALLAASLGRFRNR